MGWDSLLEDAVKRLFEQQPTPSSRLNLPVLLFYASMLHLLAALLYYLFCNPDMTRRWEYGKLKVSRTYEGRSLPHSTAWMFFESPSLLIPVFVMTWTRFCHGRLLNVLLLALFAGHYLNRSLIYTVLAKKYAGDTPDREVPLPMVLGGFIYTFFNGVLQSLSAISFNYLHESRGFAYLYAALCHWMGWRESVDFFQASQASAQDILAAGRYATGVTLFFWGMWINVQSDRLLVKLRGTKHVAEKCEYSVPLPSTKSQSTSTATRAQERCDESYGTASAATRRRKRSAENTGFRNSQRAAGDFDRKGVARLKDDRELERLEEHEMPLAKQTHCASGRSASAGSHEKSASVHSFTRSPASPYKIPRGKWFDSISCPNYFGEICEWAGFALASDTYAAFSFACFTFAFLTRRAQLVHRWYIDTFGEHYPKKRYAIFPGIL